MMGLGAELSRRGHRVEYFGMEHRGNCVGNRVGAYTKDTDYHTANPVKKVSYALRTIYSTHARRQLRRVLEDLQPQVVHLNNFNYQLTPAVILEIRAWDKATGRHTKILYTAHDYQLLCPNHMLNRPDTMENCTACLSGKYTPCVQHRCMHGSRAKSLLGAAEATLYRKAHTYKEIDRVICCSAFMQSQMEKHRIWRAHPGAAQLLHRAAPPPSGKKKTMCSTLAAMTKKRALIPFWPPPRRCLSCTLCSPAAVPWQRKFSNCPMPQM